MCFSSGLMNITVLGLLPETKDDHCIKEMPGDYCMDAGIHVVTKWYGLNIKTVNVLDYVGMCWHLVGVHVT